MKAISLLEASRIVRGEIVGGSEPDSSTEKAIGVKTDSRTVEPGDIYVARRGEFLDGHSFVAESFLRGAIAAIVERPVEEVSGVQVVVPDSMEALRDLAAFNRDVIDPIVVGITGSTGKTSTKDLIASVARTKFHTLATERSYNAEVGVPLTLLRADEQTEVAVIEMGSRGRGHIKDLCEYARPHIGAVTNIGVTHYEQFGSRAAIAESKGELIESLDDSGTAVLNGDDPLVKAMSSRSEANVITFGFSPECLVRGERVELDRLGRASFRLVSSEPRDSAWLTLSMSGSHQVLNALAAAATGIALGIPMDDIRAGLEAARGSPWRMEVREVGGVLVVNDAYNANPNSVSSALETCSQMASGGNLVAVLGYMAELGDISEEQHRRMGELAATKASRLIVVGQDAEALARGARSAGMTSVVEVEEAAFVVAELEDLEPGDVVLVKASRSAGMETLADEIAEALPK